MTAEGKDDVNFHRCEVLKYKAIKGLIIHPQTTYYYGGSFCQILIQRCPHVKELHEAPFQLEIHGCQFDEDIEDDDDEAVDKAKKEKIYHISEGPQLEFPNLNTTYYKLCMDCAKFYQQALSNEIALYQIGLGIMANPPPFSQLKSETVPKQSRLNIVKSTKVELPNGSS